MKRVLIESPFKGDRAKNARYLRAAAADCKARGEAYFASHAFYTQFLDDDDSEERAWGIEAGLAWGACAHATVVYADLGLSSGMLLGIERAEAEGRPVETRYLGGEWAWRVQETEGVPVPELEGNGALQAVATQSIEDEAFEKETLQ